MSRCISWFSCGAASAVATNLAIKIFGEDNVTPVYCDTSVSESPDNARFMREVEQWIGKPVTIIRSTKYASVDDVFEKTRYMAGIRGARCTVEMKKVPRFHFQEADDTHIIGYTYDLREIDRITRFERDNPELKMRWILRDNGITKARCFSILRDAGIELPTLYTQGYKNNNCLCCVKATSPSYWASMRRDYPEVYARRARQSREIGVRLCRLKGKRIFLDELPLDFQPKKITENISCGPECTGMQNNAGDIHARQD